MLLLFWRSFEDCFWRRKPRASTVWTKKAGGQGAGKPICDQ